jgi:hypothetical protein
MLCGLRVVVRDFAPSLEILDWQRVYLSSHFETP